MLTVIASITLLTGLGVAFYFELRRLSRSDNPRASYQPRRGGAPDQPGSFDRQPHWFVVRAENASRVADHLDMRDMRRSNWKQGLQWARFYPAHTLLEDEMPCFISPSINGWVFVLPAWSFASPHDSFQLLRSLSKAFGEAQFFIRTGAPNWSLGWDWFKNGELVRSYRMNGDGSVGAIGKPTAVERRIMHAPVVETGSDWSTSSDPLPTTALEAAFNSEDVGYLPFEVAEEWSLNPYDWKGVNTRTAWIGLAGFIPSPRSQAWNEPAPPTP